MQRTGFGSKIAGMAVAIALCATPTMAHAAVAASVTSAASVQQVSPLVTLSVFGTQASAQAVCGTTATAAAGAAATTAAQGQTGCVLPAVDAPPPPAVVETPPIEPAPTGGFGLGFSPLLLGLLGIAALAALIAFGNKDKDEPESPQ